MQTSDREAVRVRVMVVDDHPVVRSGLGGLISSDPGLELVASVDSGEAALLEVAEPGIDLVLMDLQLGGMDGAEATRRVRDIAPEVAVVVLTASHDRDDILRAFDAGAQGYVLKDASPEDLLAAIHATMRGESPMAWRTARALVDARGSTPGAEASAPATTRDAVVVPYLTARERLLLALVTEGRSDDEIAVQLDASPDEVAAELASVLPRLGASDRSGAAAWGERHL